MALPRRGGRSRVTLAFLVLLSITIITLDFRDDGGGIVDTVRDLASDVFSPVRDGADSVLSPVGDALSGVTGYGSLEDENDRLRARIAELEGERLDNEVAMKELEQLRTLNGLDAGFPGMDTVAARVVSAPVSNFEQTIELNRGSDHCIDGVCVDVGMPVVTGTGLVGRIVQVSGSRSVVRLLTDPASAVGVRLVDSGEIGSAEGEGARRPLTVGFVATQAAIAANELAVTSGFEGGSSLFPSGIPVGRVASAARTEGDLEQRVTLTPVADLDHLVFVKVVLVPEAHQ